jgi:hypothetical protein
MECAIFAEEHSQIGCDRLPRECARSLYSSGDPKNV